MNDPIRTVVAGAATVRDADPVLAAATEVADALGAELHLVHAYDVPEALDTNPELATSHEDARARFARSAQAALEARVRSLGRGAGRVHARAVPGPAAEALLRAADETGAGLLLVGATRRGPVERAFLGTTAARVARGARVPVLVLRGPMRRPGRVLLATDLSQLSAVAHERGREVAAALAGDAAPRFRSVRVVGSGMGPVGEDAARGEEARELDDFLAARTPRAGAVEARVRTGVAADEIVAEAWDWDADLLVVGTHGRTGFRRLLLGSVAETVLQRAPCSVLVIPAQPEPDRVEGAPGAPGAPARGGADNPRAAR